MDQWERDLLIMVRREGWRAGFRALVPQMRESFDSNIKAREKFAPIKGRLEKYWPMETSSLAHHWLEERACHSHKYSLQPTSSFAANNNRPLITSGGQVLYPEETRSPCRSQPAGRVSTYLCLCCAHQAYWQIDQLIQLDEKQRAFRAGTTPSSLMPFSRAVATDFAQCILQRFILLNV